MDHGVVSAHFKASARISHSEGVKKENLLLGVQSRATVLPSSLVYLERQHEHNFVTLRGAGKQ
jgi:hypothetical protein